eukprot:Pgem_evm1s19545
MMGTFLSEASVQFLTQEANKQRNSSLNPQHQCLDNSPPMSNFKKIDLTAKQNDYSEVYIENLKLNVTHSKKKINLTIISEVKTMVARLFFAKDEKNNSVKVSLYNLDSILKPKQILNVLAIGNTLTLYDPYLKIPTQGVGTMLRVDNPYNIVFHQDYNIDRCSNLGCSKKGTKKCSNCYYISYCDTECQKKDWQYHKKVCKKQINISCEKQVLKEYLSIDILTDSSKKDRLQQLCYIRDDLIEVRKSNLSNSLGVFSRAFIPSGSLIIVETPLLTYRDKSLFLVHSTPDKSLNYCNTNIMKAMDLYADPQCDTHNFKVYTKVMNKLTQNMTPKSSPCCNGHNQSSAFRMFEVANCNGFGSLDPKNSANGAIYMYASRFNHSCISNTTWQQYPNNTILLYTTKDIQKGKELVVSYAPLDGDKDITQFRTDFSCQCSLCRNNNNQNTVLDKSINDILKTFNIKDKNVSEAIKVLSSKKLQLFRKMTSGAWIDDPRKMFSELLQLSKALQNLLEFCSGMGTINSVMEIMFQIRVESNLKALNFFGTADDIDVTNLVHYVEKYCPKGITAKHFLAIMPCDDYFNDLYATALREYK